MKGRMAELWYVTLFIMALLIMLVIAALYGPQACGGELAWSNDFTPLIGFSN